MIEFLLRALLLASLAVLLFYTVSPVFVPLAMAGAIAYCARDLYRRL